MTGSRSLSWHGRLARERGEFVQTHGRAARATKRTGSLVVAGLLALLAGCGGTDAPPAAVDSGRDDTAATGAAAPPSQPRMTMTGLDLYMYDATPTDAGSRPPTFWVHAERGELQEAERVWDLEGASAVVYGEDEKTVQLDAAGGRFDEQAEKAALTGGVRMTSGEILVETEEIFWDNEAQLIRSQAPLKMARGNTMINADAFEFDPNTEIFRLTNGRGRVMIEEES